MLPAPPSAVLALARSDASLTVEDVLLLELPHLAPDDRRYVLWEHTGFPCFFAGEGHLVHQLRAQLAAWRDHP